MLKFNVIPNTTREIMWEPVLQRAQFSSNHLEWYIYLTGHKENVKESCKETDSKSIKLEPPKAKGQV